MPRGTSAPNERMLAIELLLLWEGRTSRSRLLDFFDIHPTLASRDLAAFRRAHPDAADYAPEEKAYIAASTLCPLVTQGTFQEYLGLLGADPGQLPPLTVPFASAHVDATEISYLIFSRLHRAVREQGAVRIRYRSLSHPQLHQRVIRPHAFAQAGPRWHLRAYCAEAGAFRDFSLGRISAVTNVVDASLPGREADEAWHSMVKVRLVPHRDLTFEQQQLVRAEYFGGTTAQVFNVRAAMAPYLIQAYRAAMDPDRERAPEHLLMVQAPEDLPAVVRWRAGERDD